jgi:hypothetical protein
MVTAGAVAPEARAARVQVTVPELTPQLQPVPVADTNGDGGRQRIGHRESLASSGPALETLRV